MKKDIALVVVLYNDTPRDYVFQDNGIPIIIVDNTPNRDLKILSSQITYIALKDNLGIAKALNVGFQKAKEIGAQWVLTMDQDSVLPSNMIDEYIRFIDEDHDSVGIISPLINMYEGENQKPSDTYCMVDTALTSGSLISMNAFDTSGGFKEEMFIDEVDFEFCWNIKRHGYLTYQLNRVLMQHQLGNTQEVKLFGHHLFYVTHHNYIRRYYMARNSHYVKKLHGDIMPKSPWWRSNGVISILKIVFFEKDVLRKLKARRLGIQDFKNNKFGKFDYNL